MCVGVGRAGLPAKRKTFVASMKRRLDKAALKLGTTSPVVAKGDGKIYEAWILFELAERLRHLLTVSPRDHTDAPTKTFIVRGGPGYLPAVTAPPGQPCHFRLSGNKDAAELHSSLRHEGQSTGDHELDISVLDLWVCQRLRSRGGGKIPPTPWLPTLRAAIEAKEYDTQRALPKGFSRAFLGTAVDVEVLTYVFHGPVGGMQRIGRGCIFSLFTTTTLGSSQPLLDHYSLGGFSNVRPGKDGDMTPLDHLAAEITSALNW